MNSTQVTITLERMERLALARLANLERRDINDQAAVIIREQLERLGLLEPQLIKKQKNGISA